MLIFERVFGKIVSGKNSYEKKRIATGDFWATLEKTRLEIGYVSPAYLLSTKEKSDF
jgi:hypothetical protein